MRHRCRMEARGDLERQGRCRRRGHMAYMEPHAEALQGVLELDGYISEDSDKTLLNCVLVFLHLLANSQILRQGPCAPKLGHRHSREPP